MGPPKEFSEDEFKQTLESVRVSATKRLQSLYPDKEVKVVLSQHKRSLAKQMEYSKSKKSKTSLGLHNFGAAGDYIIYMDGVKYDATGKGEKGSLKPYQVLGGAAKDAGLFWGWDFDSGHVAETRFVDEFIKKYPSVAENEDLKQWYQSNFESTKASYKPIMKLLDKKYGTGNVTREYSGEDRTVDELLKTIVPTDDKIFGYLK